MEVPSADGEADGTDEDDGPDEEGNVEEGDDEEDSGAVVGDGAEESEPEPDEHAAASTSAANSAARGLRIGSSVPTYSRSSGAPPYGKVTLPRADPCR